MVHSYDITNVASHLDFVRHIARSISARGLPPDVDPEDLIQEGWIGLLTEDQRYQAEKPPCPFETFAWKRIRGSMIDFLRNRYLMRPTKRFHPDPPEIIELDLQAHADPSADSLEDNRLIDEVRRLFGRLTPDQRDVLTSIYDDGLRPVDIARRRRCTESNVSSIRKCATRELRRWIS